MDDSASTISLAKSLSGREQPRVRLRRRKTPGCMRGEDIQQSELFTYGSLEEPIPANHPLRRIRTMVE